MKRIYLVLCWLAAISFLTGCPVSSANSTPVKADLVTPTPTITVKAANRTIQENICKNIEIEQDITLERNIEWMKETWKIFIAEDRYCIPNAQQFTIPEAAYDDDAMRRSLEAMVRHPYTYGSFTKDLLNQDFIAIVIDKTLPPPNNFSVVIFPEPKDSKTIPEPYWLFKNQDLSRSTVGGASNMIIIKSYSEDGSPKKGCFVNWNEKQKQPSCDANYKPPKR